MVEDGVTSSLQPSHTCNHIYNRAYQAWFCLSPFPGMSQGKFPPALCLLEPRPFFAKGIAQGPLRKLCCLFSRWCKWLGAYRSTQQPWAWCRQGVIACMFSTKHIRRKYLRRAEPIPCWEQPYIFFCQLLHLLYSADVKVGQSIMKNKNSNIYPAIASSARAWAYNCKVRN